MKVNKILTIFACVMVVALLYVFGSMYLTSSDQAGSGSSSANNSSDGSAQSGGSNNTANSPGNNGTSSQQTGTNQTANPTDASQENFAPGTAQQSVPVPTQPVTRQTASGNINSMQEQSQNNSVQTSQPQITQNPVNGLQ